MSAAFLPEVPASGIGDHKGIDPTIAPGLNPSTLGVISPESSAQDLTWREHLKASLVGEYHAETIMTMEEPPPPYESHSALPIRETLPYSQPTQPLTFEIPLSLRGIPDAEGFIVRKDAMRFLEEKLLPCSGQSVATSRQVVVLYGPAGVGKTRLAAEFVRRNNTSFSSIFFLSGENKEALLQDTKAALDRIWDIWPSGSTGRPLVKPTRDSAIQAAVLKWFSIAENHKWLVIFDNVDTLPTKSFDIKDFFPSADHGKILITTRLSDLNYGRIRHNLQEMDGEQACDLLVSSIIAAKRGGGEAKVTVREVNSERAAIYKLFEELDGLPLALVQAGSFIGSSNLSVSKFVDLFLASREKVLAQLPAAEEKTEDPRSNVRTTLQLSFDQLCQATGIGSQLYHNAARLLLLLAQLDSKDIWFGLLKKGVLDPGCPPWFKETMDNEWSFLLTIRVLLNFSLIKANAQEGSYSMHNITRHCCRSTLVGDEDTKLEYFRLGAVSLGYNAPDNLEDDFDSHSARFLPHAQIFLDQLARVVELPIEALDFDKMKFDERERAERILCFSDDDKPLHQFHPILNLALFYIFSYCNDDAAHAILKLLLPKFEKSFGYKHPLTLGCCRHLSWTFFCLEEYNEAEKLAVRSLEGFQELYGAEDERVLKSEGVLSNILCKNGKAREALELGKKLVEAQERLFGPLHYNTLTEMNNLAFTYVEIGEDQNAEDLMRETYFRWKEKVGPLHRKTISAGEKYADHLEGRKKWTESIPVRIELLDSVGRCRGETHVDTIAAIEALILPYNETNDLKKEEALRRHLVEISTESCGLRSFITIFRIWHLSKCLAEQKKTREATSLLECLLDQLDETILTGSNRGFKGELFYDLANLASEQGDNKAQLEFLAQAVTVWEKYPALSDDLGNIMTELALAHIRLRNQEQAEHFFQRVVKAGDPVNNNTEFVSRQNYMICVSELGEIQASKKQFDEAEKNLREALSGFTESQGGQDANSRLVMERLLSLLRKQKHWDQAAEIGGHLFEAQSKILGAQAEETLDLASNIGLFHLLRCRFADARKWLKTASDGFDALRNDSLEKEEESHSVSISEKPSNEDEEPQFIKDLDKSSDDGAEPRSMPSPEQSSADDEELFIVSDIEWSEDEASTDTTYTLNRAMATNSESRADNSTALQLVDAMEALILDCEHSFGGELTVPLHPLPTNWMLNLRWIWDLIHSPNVADFMEGTRVSIDISLPPNWSFAYEKECVAVLDGDGKRTTFKLPGPQPYLHLDPGITIDLLPMFHLLVEEAQELLKLGHEKIRAMLPAALQRDIVFTRPSKGPGCWTLTPSTPEVYGIAPLTIAGAPVVIPVEVHYPIVAGVKPPPDPHPLLIDPTQPLDDSAIEDILETFPFSKGFYLLINGMLQLLVAKKFDYAEAMSHYPNRFGGLEVSYIEATMVPTGSERFASSKMATRSLTDSEGSASSITFHTQESSYSIPCFRLSNSSQLEARLKKNTRFRKKFIGRAGLRVRDKLTGEDFLTMPSHVVRDATLKKQHDFLLRMVDTEPHERSSNWKDDVDIYSSGRKIGTVFWTFDKHAQQYPTGYDHDISLVQPLDETMASEFTTIVAPEPGIGWLSRGSWKNLRCFSVPLKTFEGEYKMKTLPNHSWSDLMTVGEGIIRSKSRMKPSQGKVAKAMKFASRFILYRIAPPLKEPGKYSGMALYVDPPQSDPSLPEGIQKIIRHDGTTGPAVIGFQSFIQLTNHNIEFDLEGSGFETQLQKGYVSFYGAFQVPEDLREAYEIQ